MEGLQMVDQVKIELEGFKALADTRMRFIEWLCNKHGIDLSEESSAFEQQEFESKWEDYDHKVEGRNEDGYQVYKFD